MFFNLRRSTNSALKSEIEETLTNWCNSRIGWIGLNNDNADQFAKLISYRLSRYASSIHSMVVVWRKLTKQADGFDINMRCEKR